MLDDTQNSPTRPAPGPAAKSPGNLFVERVLDVTHYTDSLFSFKTTRTPTFRFQSGQFTMIGLMTDTRPLLRAYSVASAVYDDWLEFYSIKVPGGPLTSRLQHIQPGDELLVGPKPTGTLLLGNLRPGKRLLLLGTGTGFAPFASVLRDPDAFEGFEAVIVAQGCRTIGELAFAANVVADVKQHELLGELAREKLHYYDTVTQEAYPRQGRLPDLITSGKIFSDLGLPALNRETDRIMICGNPGMLADLTHLLVERSFVEGNSGEPGDFVIEKAFVQR